VGRCAGNIVEGWCFRSCAMRLSTSSNVRADECAYSLRLQPQDYAISIATIHHLSTHERRKEAIQRILQCISPSHGRALIYVWAIEQDELSKRNIPSFAEPEVLMDRGVQPMGHDVFVPWVLSSSAISKSKRKDQEGDTGSFQAPQPEGIHSKTFNRYYHMFAQGELTQLVQEAARELELTVGCNADEVASAGKGRGIEIVQDGWERSNYYVELRCWKQ